MIGTSSQHHRQHNSNNSTTSNHHYHHENTKQSSASTANNHQLTGAMAAARNNNSQPQQHHHQHLVNHRTSNANLQNNHHHGDDDYHDDNGMRVGHNYQAEIPQFIAYAPAPEYYEDEKAIRVWSPNNKIPSHILDEYLTKARDKFFYNVEQALGMLSWHKFDLNRAYADLPNFVPYPNEWSVEDKVLFEQAYQFHEKNFHKIKQMLPDKTMANLINYYYGWKKNRTKASLMERQTRRFAARKTADSNNPSDDDGDDDEDRDENDEDDPDKQANNQNNGTSTAQATGQNGQDNQPVDKKESANDPSRDVEEPDLSCCICSKELRAQGRNIQVIIDGVVDSFCSECFMSWKTSGKKVVSETELGDCFYHPQGEPKKILFSYQDVLHLVEGIPEAGDIMLKHMETQVQDVKREIQTTKQNLSEIEGKIQPIAEQISDLDMENIFNSLPEYNPCKDWAHEEIQFVIQGLRRYGTDFSAISDVVRTKSPDNIKVFYVTQRERLGLDSLIEEFERNKEAARINADQKKQ